jgi:hypothetical protein
MPTEDWQKWVPIVETNRKTLERIEDKVGKIYEVVYENGLSSKVGTLWSINKAVLSAIVAIIVGIILYFATNPFSSAETNKRLERIETKIEQHLEK